MLSDAGQIDFAKEEKGTMAKKTAGTPARKMSKPTRSTSTGASAAKAASKKPSSTAPAPGSTASIMGLHQIKVGLTATANVDGHAARVDSPEFSSARSALHAILKETGSFFYGDGQIQAHHGGSIWVHDGNTWRMYQNLAGIEWSGQFCADPAKVDILRQNAKALVDRFPDTVPNLKRIGYGDADTVLNTPITDGTGIGRFVDSIFNACVPLPQPVHIGTIKPDNQRAAGKHSYPTPNDDTVFFCRSDFQPFVYDAKTKTSVQVAPVGHDPEDRRVRVVGVDQGHPLAKKKAAASKVNKALVLQANDPIAKKAFAGAGSCV
jgi:hypothetical protein